MNKKIVIDCSSIRGNINGINRYSFEIINKLQNMKGVDTYLVTADQIRNLNKKKYKKVSEWKIPFLKIIFFQIYIFFYLLKIRPDLYWSPNQRLPLCLIFFSKLKKITTIHDLCYLKFPNKMMFLTKILDLIFINFSIFLSNKIITVSNSIKNEIIKNYKTPKNKIQTIYSGSYIIKKKLKYNSLTNNKNFFLFVGTIEPRKNIKNLIEGFNKFYKNSFKSDYNLIIAGNYGWDKTNYSKLLNNLECKKNVKFMINSSDEKLRMLYKNCIAHINASFYEGFGLPIVESMSYNKFSLLSNIKVYRELTSNKFIYFNPYDPNDIANKINFFLKTKKNIKIIRSLKKKFSWEIATKQIKKILISI